MKSLEKDMEVLEAVNYIPENYIPEPVEEYTILSNENSQEDSHPQMKQSDLLPETTRSVENFNEPDNNEENDTDLLNIISTESLTTCISNAISQASVTNTNTLDENGINSQFKMCVSEKVLTLPVPCVTTSETYCGSTETFYSELSSTSISQEMSYCSENDINEMHKKMLIANNQLDTSSNPCDKFIRQNSSSSAAKTGQYLPPCRICGEKASGFHYGVNTCEACKGFFRRSIKRVNQYKCVESTDNCVIEPGKRNICPKCRFDKCLKVGMSRSAIKTGRYTHEKRSQDIREIKKLESQKESIPEAIVISQDVEDAKQLSAILVQAQKDMYGKFYEYWTSNEMILNLAKDYQKQNKVKTDIFGDLNNIPEEEFKTFYKTTGIDIDNRFEMMTEIATTLENGVSKYINFVKSIPGFTDLSLEDQAALIKVSRFEFWFIGYQRFVCIDLEVTTGMRQRCYAKSELSKVVGNEFADQLFYHSKRIQELNLTVEDIALLRSFVVFSPDRCELKDRTAVEKIQWRLLMCMKYMFELNHRPEEHFLSKVIDRVANLRVMSELNEKRAQSIKLEWPVMKNHPLLLELMSG